MQNCINLLIKSKTWTRFYQSKTWIRFETLWTFKVLEPKPNQCSRQRVLVTDSIVDSLLSGSHPKCLVSHGDSHDANKPHPVFSSTALLAVSSSQDKTEKNVESRGMRKIRSQPEGQSHTLLYPILHPVNEEEESKMETMICCPSK